MAERLRQSEEILQNGVDAFSRGEGDEARRLLNAAIDGGAPSEEALALLGRLDRLETTTAPASPARAERTRPSVAAPPPLGVGVARAVAIAVAVAAGIGVAAYAALWASRIDPGAWWPPAPVVATPFRSPSAAARETLLPLPRRGDTALARARALATSGRLHDALAALDDVHPTDSQRPDADRLRSDIQRQLLAVTRLP
jgi:hypothetical protein